MPDLNAALLLAHQSGDHTALIALYTQAADAADDIDAACFYLTHAYVFALQAGAPQQDALNLRLSQHGREPRQTFPEPPL